MTREVSEVMPAATPAAAATVRAPGSYPELVESLRPLREQLLAHRVYSQLESKQAICAFMEMHCYAVMDFMCLLKSLQQRLTVVAVPWFPPADTTAARFINEIVLGEESDVAPGGGYISHYELYVRAMRQAGADADKVEAFVELVRNHHHYRRALGRAGVPAPAQAFVIDSMSLCLTGKNHEIAAYFLFGRENLIPDLFRRIVGRLRDSGETGLDGLIYYLDRHIEIDEGEHGPASEKMLTWLVGNVDRRWGEAHKAGVRALQSRLKLWDAIADTITRATPGDVAAGEE